METDRVGVEEWLLEQSARTEGERDVPVRRELRERLSDLVSTSSILGEISRLGENLYYTRVEDGRRTLWTRRAGRDRLLLDVESIAPGETLLSWSVSLGQQYVAVNLAPAGAEIGVVHVYEIATGRTLPDRIAGVHKDFSIEWLDDHAMLYTAIDPTTNHSVVGMRLWLHELGVPTDRLLLADAPSHPIAPGEFPFVQSTSARSPWVVACITSARAAMRVYVARYTDASLAWRELASYADEIEDIRLFGDELYALASNDAPNRRIDRIDLASGARTTMIPASDVVIEGFAVARDGVYIRGSVAGTACLRRVAHDGARTGEYWMPRTEVIARVTGDPRSDGVVISIDGWTAATRLVEFQEGPHELGVVTACPTGYDRIVADTFDVTSSDGELVPLTVLRARDLVLDGSHPTILEAYGGYAISVTPSCDPLRLAWLERGGVYAIAHVRGGGEKGPTWHLAGKGTNKLNGIRDFIACARALCERGYSRPDRLAATGLSMGAVVVGGALVHAPDQFAAFAIHAGMLNPVRYLHSVNGETQREELGSPEREGDLRALVAMDVYHGISDGKRYPPILLSVGLNDERVSPWMTAKLAARLLANHSPVAIRVDRDGHGMTASPAQTANRLADTWAFFATRLAVSSPSR